MSDFFSMGGYAAFIWPCFGVTAVVLVALLVISQRRLSASRRSPLQIGAQIRWTAWKRPRARAARAAPSPPRTGRPPVKRKHKRLTFVIVALALLGAAVGLVLFAFTDNIVFFHSPTEVNEDAFRTDRRFRLGGLVEEGSVVKEQGTVKVSFRITDLAESVPVTYVGILPDLFREGQGVVAEGRLENGIFVAEEVLAKHDENYMPPEVAESLKASGKWDEMSETMKKQGHVTKGATQ